MPRSLIFKLDQSPKGRGLRCDSDGLFWGGDALLLQDDKGNFQVRPVAELQKVLGRAYGDETNWDSRIRSVNLVAKALGQGDMARATMTAVLMRLPDPCSPVRIADVDGVLAKAGFNPDEPRDERGRWTSGGDNGNADGYAADHTVGIQLADAGMSDASDDTVSQAAARAATTRQRDKTHRAATAVTAADMTNFGPSHYGEAQQLAAKLGHGATAKEFLALSSVESWWGASPTAKQAFNFFGAHNAQEGPFQGQTGTYVTSGMNGIPGRLVSKWLPPNPPSDPVQNVAAFSAETGYMDSGDVVVAALLTPKALAESGGDYSNPAIFFSTVHNHGWAEGAQTDYVHTMLQRMRHFRS